MGVIEGEETIIVQRDDLPFDDALFVGARRISDFRVDEYEDDDDTNPRLNNLDLVSANGNGEMESCALKEVAAAIAGTGNRITEELKIVMV